jgi:hypothetical protein
MTRTDPEEIDLATYQRLAAKLPRKRAKRPPRLDIPRAEPTERDGLSGLLRRGWSSRTRNNGTEWQLHEIWGRRRETQWHSDQSLACEEAKRIEREVL